MEILQKSFRGVQDKDARSHPECYHDNGVDVKDWEEVPVHSLELLSKPYQYVNCTARQYAEQEEINPVDVCDNRNLLWCQLFHYTTVFVRLIQSWLSNEFFRKCTEIDLLY